MSLRSSPPTPNARSEATRQALIAAATQVFAQAGFEAVGTREIAAAAGVHPALIAYHFGSKDGLYLAVFESIATAMEQRIGPQLDRVDQALSQPAPALERAARARALLGSLCDTMLAMLADEASGPWGPLILREQQAPTPAFDLIYQRFMSRMLDTMTLLMRTADPSRSEAAARLAVVTVFGQIVVFRVSRAGVLRHLGWHSLGKPELALAQATLRENLALLTRAPG